jgi:hypothetical protein
MLHTFFHHLHFFSLCRPFALPSMIRSPSFEH